MEVSNDSGFGEFHQKVGVMVDHVCPTKCVPKGGQSAKKSRGNRRQVTDLPVM